MNAAAKIASLILAGVVCSFYWAYVSEEDSNLEVSRMVLSQQLREKGKTAEADYYEALVRNPKIIRGIKDPKLATLTKFINSGRFDAKSAVNADVSTLSKANDAIAYARIARAAIKAGVNADIPLDKSFAIIKTIHPVIAEKSLLELIDVIIDTDDSKRIMGAIKSAPFSTDLMLRICRCSKTIKIKKLFREKLYEQNFVSENPIIASAMRLALIDTKKISTQEFEWTHRYAAFRLKVSWSIEKIYDYNFPLFAYLAYWDSNEKYYQHYKTKSITPLQLASMKAGYLGYIEYATDVFALTGDPETSIRLLSTIKNNSQRNILFKRSITNIVSTDDGINIMCQKGILK